MATTRETLARVSGNLEDSIGMRGSTNRTQLSPVVSEKDIGRHPLRSFGTVDIDRVVPDPGQPRSEFSEESIDRLAQSIQCRGQLSPIRVYWSEEIGRWVILGGERRWRAAKKAGLKSIDAFFRDNELSPAETLEEQLIDNLLREDLKPMDEAKAFAALMQLHGWTGKQLADALHVTPAKVSRALALLKLPSELQQQVDDGQLSRRSGYELAKLPSHESQRRGATEASAASHQQTGRLVRQRRGAQAKRRRGTRVVFSPADGWRVTVTGNKKATYDEVEHALTQALEEVRHYIQNGLRL